MTLLIGIDEAGYGPNFGPLCVGATAWRVGPAAANYQSRQPLPVDLYARLADIVSCKPDGERIAIADSKQLYKPASHSKHSGLRHLERGVLTALTALGRSATCWQSLFTSPTLPWYTDYNCPLPIDASTEEVVRLANRFSRACASANVQLVDMRTRLVFPSEFNRLTEKYGSKGAALSHVSIELLKSILTADGNPPLATHHSITCDKHGGRNRYAALLQHHFPNESVETVEESRPSSRYHWGPPESPTEICFRTQGESELPVALASMTAKYHRELAMRAFNAYWASLIPELKPTAGYPQDAKRFRAEIVSVQSKLEIEDHILWRNR
jgi:hypothetical protein